MGYLETRWIYCSSLTFNQWFYHPLILLAQISYYTGEDKMISLRKFFHSFTIISCHSSIRKNFSSHQPPELFYLYFFCVPSGTLFLIWHVLILYCFWSLWCSDYPRFSYWKPLWIQTRLHHSLSTSLPCGVRSSRLTLCFLCGRPGTSHFSSFSVKWYFNQHSLGSRDAYYQVGLFSEDS